MKQLVFILWMALFPVCVDIANYFHAKIMKEYGWEKNYDDFMKTEKMIMNIYMGIAGLLLVWNVIDFFTMLSLQ